MNKILFLKKNVENLNNLTKIMLFFAFLILTIFPYKNVHAVVNGERIADENTSDYYKNTISNKNLGTFYDGSIWSDKSVYTEKNIMLDNKFKIENNDDFLTVFSALGSSQVVKSPEILDMMFVIDISGSMGQVNSIPQEDITKTPMYKTVNALNGAVNQILKLNPEARIGITVYGTTAALLLPLGNYSVDSKTSFMSVELLEVYGSNQGLHFKLTINAIDNDKKQMVVRSADNSGLSSYEYHNGKSNDVRSSGNSIIKGTSGHTDGNGTPDNPYHVGHITNQQAGLAQGLQALANADETTWKSSINGQVRSHIPCMIHITDGQASDISTLSNGSNWYNVDINTDIAYTTRRDNDNFYNVNQLGDEYMAIPTIFQTLMTASYYTTKVNKHYQNNAREAMIENPEDIAIMNYSIYASDSNPLSNMEDGRIKTIIQAINNPSKYFTKDSKDELITGTKYGEGAYNLFEQWKNGTFINNKYKGNTISITLNASTSQLVDDEYGITVDDIVKNINYIESDNFLSTGFNQLSGVIESIIQEQNARVATPISNSLSYVDPIGEYLELKSFKKAILFGNEYNIIKDRFTEEENVTKQYYKVVGNNNEDLTIINKSNKNLKFKLSDIIIYNQIVDNKQEIHINIPRNALPLKVDTIEMNDNNVTTYVSNVDSEYALPIRFIYSVGVNDKYLKNNNIKISDISETYIQNNKNSNSLYFYSNTYNKTEYDKKTIGDAYVTFVPSKKNEFYFLQKNYSIFKKSSSGEGILKSSGGNVELTEQLKDLNEIKEDELYYIEHEYFIPTTEDTFKGKLVKYAMEVKGSDFYDSNGNLLVTYYDETKDEETNNKSDNTIVTTKKGICIEGIIDKLSITKTNNLTNTAAYSNVSEFIDGNIKTNLGNNGVIIVDSNTGGEILVNPKTGVLRPTIVLIVLGTLAVLLYYKLRKKSSYEI